jgi:hypothetical protein
MHRPFRVAMLHLQEVHNEPLANNDAVCFQDTVKRSKLPQSLLTSCAKNNMAEKESHAPSLPLDNTTPPVAPEIEKPEAVHERPTSMTSADTAFEKESNQPQHKTEEVEERVASLHSNDDLEKPANAEDADPNKLEKTSTTASFQYPGVRERILVMIAILLAVFLIALDRTIIATAIPKMTDEFHSLDDIGWYGSAFMLTSSCFQLLIGRIYTFHSAKYVFLILILIFEIGSAICGAAPTSVAVSFIQSFYVVDM